MNGDLVSRSASRSSKTAAVAWVRTTEALLRLFSAKASPVLPCTISSTVPKPPRPRVLTRCSSSFAMRLVGKGGKLGSVCARPCCLRGALTMSTSCCRSPCCCSAPRLTSSAERLVSAVTRTRQGSRHRASSPKYMPDVRMVGVLSLSVPACRAWPLRMMKNASPYSPFFRTSWPCSKCSSVQAQTSSGIWSSGMAARYGWRSRKRRFETCLLFSRTACLFSS
mmetsp:Transcript_69716/g.179752  ORF Transcript_69716/g.179752 Transcript_69716/m.179752 type:complete len:223 (-) Transcript_69716:393-1061(-)